ncbi:MAG: aminotransferase class V-fold PLP-dependent enzyme [Lactobacillus helveticus]
MDKNIKRIRGNFPILKRQINESPLIYLDNAATTQIPVSVSKKIMDFDETYRANVHRGVHTLGMWATEYYESVREKVKNFIHAKSKKEIVFTSGCTDSLNLVAATYGEQNIQAGDEIVVSIMEHHSNLLPWQQLAIRKHAKLKFIELDSKQQLDLADAKNKITSKTKIVAVAQVSNALGCINPIKELAKLAHQNNAVIVVDGAQAVGHFDVDVQKLDADFYAFSGHKMFGPDGIGVLYGRKKLLEKMPPYRLGGEMIADVTREGAVWAPVPQKFEAGTPNIEGVIGLEGAIDFIECVGLNEIRQHEQYLIRYLLPRIQEITGITVYGPKDASDRTSVISFNVHGIHPHDLATALDLEGIEVRAGHHCAQPLMKTLGVESTVRVSVAIYNSQEEMDKFLDILVQIKEFFQNGLR